MAIEGIIRSRANILCLVYITARGSGGYRSYHGNINSKHTKASGCGMMQNSYCADIECGCDVLQRLLRVGVQSRFLETMCLPQQRSRRSSANKEEVEMADLVGATE